MADGNLSKDQERLAKLWDAYEVQEKELELSMKNIANLENKIKEMDRVNIVLKKAVEDRDREIRELELKVISLEEDNSKFQPQIEELQKLHNEEKERYSKLFAISEELEDDLAKTKNELEIKDKWFQKNVGMLENIRESIIDRNVKLQSIEELTKDLGDKTAEGESEQDSTSESPESTLEEKEKGEDITFKTVKLEEKNEPETATKSKDETIYEFTKIPNIDATIAEKLFNSGYSDLDKLKETTTEDLSKIDGISPTLARKIRTDIFEMK
jgi:DNA repair exonuclease SbcCD ATPase subunit